MKSVKPNATDGPQETPVTVYSTPRERFMADGKAAQSHRDMVDTASFEDGADAAMVEFATNLGKTVTDANSAISAGYQLRGASKFLRTFKELAELTAPPPPRRDPDNLTPTEPQRRV